MRRKWVNSHFYTMSSQSTLVTTSSPELPAEALVDTFLPLVYNLSLAANCVTEKMSICESMYHLREVEMTGTGVVAFYSLKHSAMSYQLVCKFDINDRKAIVTSWYFAPGLTSDRKGTKPVRPDLLFPGASRLSKRVAPTTLREALVDTGCYKVSRR